MNPASKLSATALAVALLTPLAAAAQPHPGEPVFLDNCAACHQPTGKGVPGAFPALDGDPFVTGPPEPVASTVLNGRGGMPAFKSELTDDQIAAVVSYIRGGWSNKAPPVAPPLVGAVRNATGAAPQQAGLQAH